jgi:hypothetical protein
MKRTLTLLALSLLVISCGDKKKGASEANDTSVAATKDASGSSTTGETSTDGGKKMYTVKSGIVELKNSMMDGMKQTIYFDDYGAKQATYTTMEMMGQKTESVQINADGWITTYDLAKKTGTKMKMPAGTTTGSGQPPTAADLTDEQKKQYNYKELDGRDIAGKSTKGYSMDVSGMKIKAWTWNNVPLYMEMEMGQQGKPIIVEATNVQTDVDIPADKFKVPADVTVTEASMPGMPAPAAK